MVDSPVNDNITAATPLYTGRRDHEQRKKSAGETCYLNAVYSYRRCFNIAFVRKEEKWIYFVG